MIDPAQKIPLQRLFIQMRSYWCQCRNWYLTCIDDEVEIGEGSWVSSHVVIKDQLKLAVIIKFINLPLLAKIARTKNTLERTFLEIGDANVIREHCTPHRGTVQDQCLTKSAVVTCSWLTYMLHDCMIGDDCIFANNATLAGHVHIGDWVIFGGLAAIHQFGRVGSHAFIAGMAALNKDVPPYVMAAGIMPPIWYQ